MRICLISREYPPETGFGGIATFTRHLAHGLKEIGHDVEVIALSKDEDKVQNDDGITIHRVKLEWLGERLGTISLCMPYSRYVLMASTTLWRKFYERHIEKPFDVVDTPELLAEGLFPAITRSIPLLIRLYTPHSKFIKEKLHNVTPSFDHEFVAAIERVAMLSCDVLTSPSLDLAKYVADDLSYDLDDIHIVRNPINPDQFSPEGELAIEKDGRKRVLFVGRLEERKGIHYLVKSIPQVVSKHKNVEFVIIGDDTKNATGQKSVLDELKAIIEKDKTEQYVRFIPRIKLDELPAYYRSADISIVPSIYDNSPYTCQEAMSCGNPVIGTNSGGTAEYLVDGESGIAIPPRDENAIADALNALISDDNLRIEMGRKARRRVVEHFDRKEIARQTCALYDLAVERHGKRSESEIYRKDPGQVLKDAYFMMKAFDTMIYDTMYQFSWRFRIKHWARMIKKRPRLFIAKTALKLNSTLESVLKLKLGTGNKFHDWVLEESYKRQIDSLPEKLLEVSSKSGTEEKSIKEPVLTAGESSK